MDVCVCGGTDFLSLPKIIINIHTSKLCAIPHNKLSRRAQHEGRKHERCTNAYRYSLSGKSTLECRQGEVPQKLAQQAISAHTRCNGDFGIAFLRSLKHKRSSNPFPDKSFRKSKGFPSGLASNLLLCGVPSEGRPGFVGSARVSCSSCHACSRAGKSSGDSRL